ncbi:MAG TPA: DUF2510 domain-containing protein [Terrimesophilobacter sp.]|nr:DUF2510 domain-containing protein [Terrimesophilobacter sp.]
MSNPQPGWYPDHQRVGALRWWDGTQWTEHRHATPSFGYATPATTTAAPTASPYTASPYSTTNFGELKAPTGTDGNTPWIWLIVILPLLPILALLTIDWANLIDVNDRTGLSVFRLFFAPGYLFAVLGGWVGYGLCVLFAYRDSKELADRGLPKPFHWAWAFLSSLVYVIGRSVVVRRRTGSGSAPLWAAIVSIVLMIGVMIYMVVAMVLGTVGGVQQLGV